MKTSAWCIPRIISIAPDTPSHLHPLKATPALLQDLTTGYNGTGSEPNAVKVNLCSSHHHLPWVEVHRTGLLHFHNDQGDEASCNIDEPLVKGKSCTIGSIAKTSTSSMRPMPTSSDATSHGISAKATGVTTSISAASSKVPDSTTDC
ncbi:hypothetical protein N7466_001530 [Penicillium verhagenii]|uniref:uncharacterized protein n=1 Tax=Penicillium verhagenii TaxID=1562060 RepID=UPI00254536B1|nr:uncharacterized protein N7466_001530 [Penicillium verhagenii]KAJ5938396.1 hypothetical protein N7466_001530 [Penicillium verhagenii]